MKKAEIYNKASRFALEHKFYWAMRLIDKYLIDFPDDTDLLILKGNIFDIQLKYDESIKLYRKVLSKDKKNLFALIDLGDVYRHKEQYKKAIQYYDMAINLIKENTLINAEDQYLDACHGKAEVLLLMKSPAEALNCLKSFMEDYPNQSEYVLVLYNQAMEKVNSLNIIRE